MCNFNLRISSSSPTGFQSTYKGYSVLTEKKKKSPESKGRNNVILRKNVEGLDRSTDFLYF